ncbi:MAG: hypothetical protein ISS17_05205 [Bacteroidales bacterium]|nr:hypothetical protein [Bacteroidales bacterium]
MKKLLTVLALVTLGCFALNTSVFSQTTICFDLNITDNCSGQWYGYYTARVSVTFGGNEYCSTTINDLSEGWNLDLSYECSELPIEEQNPCYIINVTVCRQELLPTCCGSKSSNSLSYSDLESCSTPQINVTLN